MNRAVGVTFGVAGGPFGPYRRTPAMAEHLTRRKIARILGDVKLNAMNGQQV